MATCPNCGSTTGEGAIFCDQCGTRLPQPGEAAPQPPAGPAGGSMICPACGAGNVPGEAFCDFCGSPLEAPVPTAPDAPELEPVSREAELEVDVEPPAPSAEAAPAEPAEVVSVCPACGEAVSADEAFCAACGASLALPPLPPEPVPELEPEPPPPPLPDAEVEPPPSPDAEPEPPPAAEPEAPPPEVEPEAPPPPEAEPEAPPPPEAEPEAPPPPAPAEAPGCPACGEEVEAGDAFCSSCGYALKAAPIPPPAAEEAVAPPVAGPAPAGPRLVIADSGAEIPLPTGDEILVGREDPVSGIYPDVDLTPHGGEEGGVSRQHARITVEGGNYFVEDLDSTNFTFVNKQKLAPKTRQPVGDGDEIRFGRVAAVLRTGS